MLEWEIMENNIGKLVHEEISLVVCENTGYPSKM
jgi:hypothetical protein